MAYTIMISEAQRAFLLSLLKNNRGDIVIARAKFETADLEHMNLDPDLLCRMFEDLTEDEAQLPGCIHGFCL